MQAGAPIDNLAAGGRGLVGPEGQVMQGEGADRPGGSGARLGGGERRLARQMTILRQVAVGSSE